MTEYKKPFIISLISCVTMLVPLGGLVWSAARLSAKVDEHEKRILQYEQLYSKDIAEINKVLSTMSVTLAEQRMSLYYIQEKLNGSKSSK